MTHLLYSEKFLIKINIKFLIYFHDWSTELEKITLKYIQICLGLMGFICLSLECKHK